ncbi:MAG TPA: hypothetical protein VH589_04845 [Trebonia sp.]|jgi:hypothetical protein
MHPIITGELAAQRIASLHEEAARQRLLGDLRAAIVANLPDGSPRGGWVRLRLRRSGPVAV